MTTTIGFSPSPTEFFPFSPIFLLQFFVFIMIISWHVFFSLNGGRFEKNFCSQMKLFPVKRQRKTTTSETADTRDKAHGTLDAAQWAESVDFTWMRHLPSQRLMKLKGINKNRFNGLGIWNLIF